MESGCVSALMRGRRKQLRSLGQLRLLWLLVLTGFAPWGGLIPAQND